MKIIMHGANFNFNRAVLMFLLAQSSFAFEV